MRFAPRQIGLVVCCVAAGVLFVGGKAHAGYVPAQIKTPSSFTSLSLAEKDYLTFDSGSNAGVAVTDCHNNESPQKDQIHSYATRLFAIADFSPSGTGTPTSGNSSPTTGSAGTLLALPAVQDIPSPALTGWLVGERLFYQPDPIASGLFHPPRMSDNRLI